VGPAPARRRVLQIELAVMAFLAAVPSLVIALEGLSDPSDVDLDIGVLELVASLLASLGPAAMAVYLLWRDGQLRAAGFGRRPASFVVGYGALGWVCCFIAITMVGSLIIIFGGSDAGGVEAEEGVELTVGTFFAVLGVALTAGIGEEILFRAYAITRMEEAGFGRAAVIVPWAVFTVLHVYQGVVALLAIGALAAVFTWLYRWQRSVWPVMVAHALYDVSVLLLAATV